MRKIVIKGAKERNLKGIDLELPHGMFVCFVGPSGSGKSTLLFDVIGKEAERRLIESLSPQLRQYFSPANKPNVERIDGLCPPIFLTREVRNYGPRSTVGTFTEIYDYLRVLFAKFGLPFCPDCQRPLRALTREQMVEELLRLEGKGILILVPIRERNPQELLKEGFLKAYCEGQLVELESLKLTTFDLVIDRLTVRKDEIQRIRESLELALRFSPVVKVLSENEELLLTLNPFCPECELEFPSLTPSLFSFNTPEGACPKCKGLGEIDGKTCDECGGKRLNKWALSVRIEGWDIASLSELTLEEFQKVLNSFSVPQYLEDLLEAINEKLTLLFRVGLSYLNLGRLMDDLSRGEAQRLRMVNEISMGLSGVMYLLDEPTASLHPEDQKRVLMVLKELKEKGNTLLVVEHNPDTILQADWIVELGPGGGEEGGRVVFTGKPIQILSADTVTGKYLKERSFRLRTPVRVPKGWIRLKGIKKNNLRNINVNLPLGVLCGLIGVSGAGKSTLVLEVLAQDLKRVKEGFAPLFCESLLIEGEIERVIVVEQKPFAKDRRAIVATYSRIFDIIRDLFSQTKASRIKGWGPERFSFNLPYGRCEFCKGEGEIKVELGGFLPEVRLTCEHCGGTRYQREVLEVKYKGLHIGQVLDLTVEEALRFFQNVPSIKERLEPLKRVGLSYLKLGQPLFTLSGGEGQRLRIARELTKNPRNTLYLLDEPTGGLHPQEVKMLLEIFNDLIERGASIIFIDHNFELLSGTDYLIELGPKGGREGGKILKEGMPHQVLREDFLLAK